MYVASSGGELKDKLRENGILHIDLNIDTKCELNPKLIKVVFFLKRFVRENDINIIHAQTRVAQAVSFFVSKFTGIPFVSTCHGFFESELSKRLFGLWGKKVIAINDAVKEYMVNTLKIKKSKIEVISNGIDISYFSKRFSNEELDKVKGDLDLKNFRIVGTISRLVSVKGVEYLIDAANLIIKERKDIAFIIIGSGPQKDFLVKKVRDYKIEKRVKFIDALLDIRPYLRIMDIFVHSPIQEGFGISIIEAMASGKPVVATAVGGICVIVKNEKTGLLIPSKDAENLKSAIIRLLDDATLSHNLSQNAKQSVYENFNIEDTAQKTLALYREVAFGK